MRNDGPVVIALDGSVRSGHTLGWGLEQAERLHAEVVLARAAHLAAEYPLWGWYPDIDPGFELEAKSYLAETLERAQAMHPALRVRAELLRGPAVAELLTQSESAQLLVVGAGTRSRGLGRTAAHLVAHARCPVAVVRPVRTQLEGWGTMRGPVVTGVDGSPASIEAAHRAAREAVLRGAGLLVVHARPTIASPFGAGVVPPHPAAEGDEEPVRMAVQRLVDALQQEHRGLEVESSVVDDDPADALVEASYGAQLLVVGSRGLGAFRGMLLGSVSNDVARHAPCPVLVLHGADPD